VQWSHTSCRCTVTARTVWRVDFVNACFFNRRILFVTGMVLIFCLLTACSKSPEKAPAERRLIVITTLFPLYDFAKQIGGEQADVTLLLPPGVEPHSFEPKPGDLMKLESADLFIYTGGRMEPWAATVLSSLNAERLIVIDASAGLLAGDNKEPYILDKKGAGEKENKRYDRDIDPHVWLDFGNAQKMVRTIVRGFAMKDPAHKEYYTRNAQNYVDELARLDEEYKRVLADCKQHVIIHGGHFAFNYLAKRYHLLYMSAYSGSPDAEPTAAKLIQLKEQIKKYGVHYIFYEELITPRVAEIIANETGVSMLKLNGAHNVTREEMAKGVTFLGIMEQNLNNLKKGLECR